MISSFLILYSFVVLFSAFYGLEKVWADPVIATIPVGNDPSGIAYDPASKEMYVSNFASNTVSVINTSSNLIVGNPIPVGKNPEGIAYDPDNMGIYVTISSSNTVSVINTFNNAVVGTIPVGTAPIDIAYNSDNHYMYVSILGSNAVSVISKNPFAEVGPNQGTESFQTVHLDGSASFDPSGSPLTYLWTQTSGPTVIITGPEIATPTFEAPDVHSNTTLTFQLVVTNSNGEQSNPSEVTITVFPHVPPIADAGRNQEVQPLQTVHLDGSASFDPYNFTPLTYQWTQTSGPTISLSSPISPNPSFIAPRADKDTPITFQLVVTNSIGISSSPSEVTIISRPVPPIADAGRNQEVQPLQTVHLDGSASFDPSGFIPLTYQWTQTSGPTISLSNPNSATPSFVAPNVSDDTTLSFQLVVTNSIGVPSSPSSVVITILVLSSSHPSPHQNNGTLVNSNISSFNNDRFSNHNTSVTNSNVESFNNNGHNTYLNHQSQNSYNFQNPMCLTVFGSCDANNSGQSQNMYNGQDR